MRNAEMVCIKNIAEGAAGMRLGVFGVQDAQKAYVTGGAEVLGLFLSAAAQGCGPQIYCALVRENLTNFLSVNTAAAPPLGIKPEQKNVEALAPKEIPKAQSTISYAPPSMPSFTI